MPFYYVIFMVIFIILAIMVALLFASSKLEYRGGGDVEYELQYLNFNEQDIKARLGQLNAKNNGAYMFKAYNFKTNGISAEKNKLTTIRVRDEGHRQTMTVKTKKPEDKFDVEHEVTINSYEEGVEIFRALGLEKFYYMEKLREIYLIDGCELIFDTAPGLPTRIEIEGPSEAAVVALADKLGLNSQEDQSVNGSKIFFEKYGIPLDHMGVLPDMDLTFDNVIDKFLPLVVKNKDEFIANVELQRAKIRAYLDGG